MGHGGSNGPMSKIPGNLWVDTVSAREKLGRTSQSTIFKLSWLGAKSISL